MIFPRRNLPSFDKHFPMDAIFLHELHLTNGIRCGISVELVQSADDLRSVSNVAGGRLKLVFRSRLQIEEDRLRRATRAPLW